MVTFLPYADLRASMEALDYQRLGKQRLEALWMLKKLLDGKTHTVSIMWQGHTDALCYYGQMACLVWRERGYKDNLWPDFYALMIDPTKAFVPPPWWGSHLLHSSHRGNLLRKDIGYYGVKGKGWTDPIRETYFWPHNGKYDWRTKLGDKADSSYKGSSVQTAKQA